MGLEAGSYLKGTPLLWPCLWKMGSKHVASCAASLPHMRTASMLVMSPPHRLLIHLPPVTSP
jgi:hypothetical protein